MLIIQKNPILLDLEVLNQRFKIIEKAPHCVVGFQIIEEGPHYQLTAPREFLMLVNVIVYVWKTRAQIEVFRSKVPPKYADEFARNLPLRTGPSQQAVLHYSHYAEYAVSEEAKKTENLYNYLTDERLDTFEFLKTETVEYVFYSQANLQISKQERDRLIDKINQKCDFPAKQLEIVSSKPL